MSHSTSEGDPEGWGHPKKNCLWRKLIPFLTKNLRASWPKYFNFSEKKKKKRSFEYQYFFAFASEMSDHYHCQWRRSECLGRICCQWKILDARKFIREYSNKGQMKIASHPIPSVGILTLIPQWRVNFSNHSWNLVG